MNIDVIFNYTVGIIGTILGIIGIVLAVKSIKKKEPTYSIKSVNVISDYATKFENLTVAYKDEKVENFTVSKILFFNRGRETITKEDVDTISPLKISSETCNILDASILQVNKVSNNFKIDLDRENNHIFITFDYLDKNQGVVIQIVHNGLSSDDLLIEGDIKGVQKLVQSSPESLEKNTRWTSTDTKAFLLAIFFSIIWWLGLNYWSSLGNSDNSFINFFGIVIIIVGVFSTFVAGLMIIIIVIQFIFPSVVLPKGLEKFNE